MLSPHELATLLLVKEAPDQVEIDRPDLDALLERQFVRVETLASGRPCARLTLHGDAILKAVARLC
ncbi:phage tail assembly chaperone [Paraburkholderia terrae]|uniref:hypothetical protein n=1 Tax=Paraburkholderia terrae TaxID=311230 RepID=UPI0030E25BE1